VPRAAFNGSAVDGAQHYALMGYGAVTAVTQLQRFLLAIG